MRLYLAREPDQNLVSQLLVLLKSRHWELSCKTDARQKITKIDTNFDKIWVNFQCSLPKKKVFKFIKKETLHRYFSSIKVLQLYRRSIFLVWLWMFASHHLFYKCSQLIMRVKLYNNASNYERKVKATNLVKLLPLYCTQRARSLE